MNKHFEDTRYYLRRATETAVRGVKQELAPIEARFREVTGPEKEPEPSAIEEIRDELRVIQERLEGEAERAIADVRERLNAYRKRRTV